MKPLMRSAGKDAETGNCEANLGAPEYAGHVRLSEQAARRVTIVTAAKGHQVLAARDCRIVGERRAPQGRAKAQAHKQCPNQRPHCVSSNRGPHHSAQPFMNGLGDRVLRPWPRMSATTTSWPTASAGT